MKYYIPKLENTHSFHLHSKEQNQEGGHNSHIGKYQIISFIRKYFLIIMKLDINIIKYQKYNKTPKTRHWEITQKRNINLIGERMLEIQKYQIII